LVDHHHTSLSHVFGGQKGAAGQDGGLEGLKEARGHVSVVRPHFLVSGSVGDREGLVVVEVFPDRASALRLITAVALRGTETWASRRYLDLSLLEEITEGAVKAA